MQGCYRKPGLAGEHSRRPVGPASSLAVLGCIGVTVGHKQIRILVGLRHVCVYPCRSSWQVGLLLQLVMTRCQGLHLPTKHTTLHVEFSAVLGSSRFLVARHTTRLMAWTLRVRGTNGQAVISGLAADSNCLELQEKIHDKLGIAPARQELLAGFPPRIIQVCSQTATSCGCFYLMLTSTLYVSCNLFITSTREQIKWTPQLSVGRVHISSDSMHEHGTWHTHCNHPGSSLYADICKWTAIRCWYCERRQLDSAGEGLA